jgi:hypothetical protein
MTHVPTNVVDLARFRADRDQARLPLFDGPAPIEPPPPATGVLAMAGPALSDRQVQHRARMLRYLTAARPARFAR